jgi:hypothetical protein
VGLCLQRAALRRRAVAIVAPQEAHLGVGISGKEGLQESPPLAPAGIAPRRTAPCVLQARIVRVANSARACCQRGSCVLPAWIVRVASSDRACCKLGSCVLPAWIVRVASADRACCKLGSCVLQARIVRVATVAGGERVGLCDRAVCVPQAAAARARPLELRPHVHDHQVSEAVPNHTLRPRPRARRTRTRTHRSDWRAAVGAASACGRTALAHGVRRYVVYKNFVIALTMFFFGFWCRNAARCIRRQLSLVRRTDFGCTRCRTRCGRGRRAFLQPD